MTILLSAAGVLFVLGWAITFFASNPPLANIGMLIAAPSFIAFILLLVVALTTRAQAEELPCPPKHYFCWQANWAFEKYGVPRVVAKAKVCGWTREEISEALKCR